MYKKILIIAFGACLFISLPSAAAKDLVIEDYTFTWRVAKVGAANIRVEKEKGRLEIVLSAPGGGLATLRLQPSEATAIAEVLLKTEGYYNKLKEEGQKETEIKVSAGNHEVVYSLPKGKPFEVIIKQPKFFGAALIVKKEEALEIGGYLRNSQKMADLVNSRIKP